MLKVLFLALLSEACEPSTFFDPLIGACIPCETSCAECTSNKIDLNDNCLSCSDPMKRVLNGNCYYPCELSGDCSICGYECITCYDSGCELCYSPYVIHKLRCEKECPSGYFVYNGRCVACDQACNGCTGPLNTDCIECQTGFELINDACKVPTCGDGFKSVGEECDDFSDGNCLNCKTVNCELSQFWDSQSKQCRPCDVACQGCIGFGPFGCLTCVHGYNFVEGQCVENICGDGILAGEEECDDNKDQKCKGCKVVQCFGAQLVSSEYFSDYSGLFLQFSQEVSCVDCQVFENYWVLGESPKCICTASRMKVYFGESYQVFFNTVLVIGENELGKCGSRIEISVQGLDPNFKVELLGNKHLVQCEKHLNLRVKVFSSGSSQLLSYNWQVIPENPKISQFLKNKNVWIPVELVQNQSVSFIFTATNYLGQNFTSILNGDYSIVQDLDIISPSLIKATQQYPIFMRAKFKTCEKVNQIFVDWEILDDTQTKIEKFGMIAKVWNDKYDFGDFFKVKIRAWVNEDRIAEKVVKVLYERAEIEAVIDKHCVKSMEGSVLLSGLKSRYGSSGSGVDYKWTVKSGSSVIFTSNSSEILIEKSENSLYSVELSASKSGSIDFDLTSIEFSDKLNSYITAGSLKIRKDSCIDFTKTNKSAEWISNLYTNYDKSSDFTRFFYLNQVHSPWVGTDTNCKVPLKIVKAPKNGNFQVYPTEGIAWKTVFQLEAGAWDSGYFYQFFYSYDEEYIPITDMIYSSTIYTYLPFSGDLKIKLRVYSLERNFEEQVIGVYIKDNQNNLLEIQNSVLENLHANDYEAQLSAGLVLGPCLENFRTGFLNSSLLGRKLNKDTKILSTFSSKLLKIVSLASLNLPNTEYLDSMITILLNGIVQNLVDLNEKDFLSISLILKKRLSNESTITVMNNTLSIVNKLLDNKNLLSINRSFYEELESILLKIGLNLAKKQVYESAFVINNEKFSIQAINLRNRNFSLTKAEINNSYFGSAINITSSISAELTILNLFELKLKTLSNASVVLQSSNNAVSGLVFLDDYNSSETYKCQNLNKNFTAIIKDSEIWCNFTGSARIRISSTVKINNKSRRKGKSEYYSPIFLGSVLGINILWFIWGFRKDKKDFSTVFPEVSPDKITSFFLALKKLHFFLGIFFRFNAYRPRVIRICLFNIRVFTLISSIIAFSPHIPLYSVLIFSYLLSICLYKLLSVLLKKKIRRFIKSIQDPPNLRDSPSIKLPDLRYSPTIKRIDAKVNTTLNISQASETVQYMHIRNYSESNPVQDTNFTYDYKFEYNKAGMLLGTLFGTGLCLSTFWLVWASDFTWYFWFLLILSSDLLVFQVLLLSFQYFVLKKVQIFQKFLSKILSARKFNIVNN